jgi:hypothetical protein
VLVVIQSLRYRSIILRDMITCGKNMTRIYHKVVRITRMHQYLITHRNNVTKNGSDVCGLKDSININDRNY